ncbi:MAG: Flp family type IVb pilin [Rhodospirillales bacterium]|jgi:pilus assembly protein Flp/PilA|nr:Flp family type IVb pilin [Rhodospirillales bacterium]
MTKFIAKFLRDDNGATAIEYGLIAALVAVAAMGTIGLMGEELDKTFLKVKDELGGASQ